ncbi:Isoamyl acetate-hydrolyzing esterase [Candida viswanathii]|uniref:Isoamyl acetate-hydrolyzing esterase n=1 Tax=Candida viswanathii TaxID=5486 RepID=A0A367Y5M3_9ASCO|nr:Isoamyl acetate-hydrolyzing esterase [Candida viswanathii]
MNYKKFLLFGDSITQFSNDQGVGFVLQPALQNLYATKLDVVNRGYSGYNSEHARLIFPEILKAEMNAAGDNIPLMTVFFGTNDAFDNTNDIQPVGLERYAENIEFVVLLAKKNKISVVVIGPSLHDPKLAKAMFASNGRTVDGNPTTNKRMLLYSEAAKKVAERNGVPFVDLWNAFRKDHGWTEQQLFDVSYDREYVSLEGLLHDGIHFTGRAYKILYELVERAIAESYPELAPDKLPMKLRDWKDIEPADLSSIFRK